jgi:hypothetical protein
LSDQQLVTGLAILTTGYHKQYDMSGYHFSLVAASAWFSSTTHLSTLAVLYKYFKGHPVLKSVRLIGMVCLMGLLFHATLYLQWLILPSVPIQCTFIGGFPLPPGPSPAWWNQFISYSEWFGIVAFLFFAYGNNIVRLFAKKPASSILTLFELRCRQYLRLPPVRFEASWVNWAITDFESGSGVSTSAAIFTYSDFLDSFLWELVWLLFGNTFGFLQISTIVAVPK